MSDNAPSLKDVNSLGVFFGRLSEVHVKNMEAFPFIYFNDLKEAHIDYDIANKKGDTSLVTYDLKMGSVNDHLEKRYKALEEAVRALFWKEVKLGIKINGEEVYKSE